MWWTFFDFTVYHRDKKARRAEKHKGKGKRDEESSKNGRQNSPGEQDGEVTPPVIEEVCVVWFWLYLCFRCVCVLEW